MLSLTEGFPSLGIDADRSFAQERPLSALCADDGEGERLILVRSSPAGAAIQGGLEFLLEVTVEEAVNDGVDAGRGHGREVTRGEDGVVLAGRDGLVVPVEHRVEDVERQPAERERHHDGDQHGVDPLGPVGLLLMGIPGPLHHVPPPP